MDYADNYCTGSNNNGCNDVVDLDLHDYFVINTQPIAIELFLPFFRFFLVLWFFTLEAIMIMVMIRRLKTTATNYHSRAPSCLSNDDHLQISVMFQHLSVLMQ